MTSTLASAQETQQRPGFNPLVPIQLGKSLPFFCVHGAGGNVLNFRDIATRLGADQTFYGVQAAGVDGGAALDTIEEMAALYLPAITANQPKGPYMIGGYSTGGVVAYEIAQQLVAAGQNVALLVLLDSFAAHVKPQTTSLKLHLEYFKHRGPAYLSDRVKARLQRQVDSLSDSLKARFYRSQNQPIPFELRETYLSRALGDAALRYRPKPYAGSVVLYRATDVDPQFQHTGEKLGWETLVPHAEIVRVPGNHDSLVYEPNVQVLISHLRQALRNVGNGAS